MSGRVPGTKRYTRRSLDWRRGKPALEVEPCVDCGCRLAYVHTSFMGTPNERTQATCKQCSRTITTGTTDRSEGDGRRS